MKKIILLAMIIGCVLICSCNSRNGLNEFYTGAKVGAFPKTKKVTIKQGLNLENHMSLMKNGYLYIGRSGWTGGKAGESSMKTKAKSIGAEVVYYNVRYLGSRTSSVPITTYQPGQTSTINTTGNINSGGQYSTYNSTSYVQSSGTSSTQYVPITVHRFEQHVHFYRKIDTSKMRLGVYAALLSAVGRKKLGSDHGLIITVVYYNTPAHKADFLENDIIIEINNIKITEPKLFSSLILKSAKDCNIKIWRDGKILDMKVKLNL